MYFCQYLEEFDIHVIDYSGRIDMQEGLSRIEKLETYFEVHRKVGIPLKVLMDASGYINESQETHSTLAKFSREKFDGKSGVNKFTAVLNDEFTCAISERESWFTSRDEAMKWLFEQSM